MTTFADRRGNSSSGWYVAALLAVVAGGCASVPMLAEPMPPPAVSVTAQVEQPVREPMPSRPAAAAPSGPLDVREIRVVEDNGQVGIFVKLTGEPAAVNHFALDRPGRVVIELEGLAKRGGVPERIPVNNPLIESLRLGASDGKLRLAVQLRGEQVPAYAVDTLHDTLVVFLGEPSGRTQPVREQVVFSAGRPVAATGAPAAKVASAQGTNEISGAVGKRSEGQPRVYSGQRISLDFKDADVHNVLRLLADVSKLNIVATEDVRGKITLKLTDVPWDQALDIVLQSLNLESVQEGNVLRISTVARLKEEREELRRAQEAAKAVEPLRVEYIRVNYAKASKLAELISGAQRIPAAGLGGRRRAEEEEGVLTSRGSVMSDEYTNTLIVRDIARGIENARELVRRLDVQTPQVLIESNIVEATTDFAQALGIQWGYRANIGPESGNPTGVNFPGSIGVGGSGLGSGSGGVPFLVDFFLGSVDGSQALNARLSALEEQGKGKVISRPRVVTLNNVPATIKSLTIIRVKLPSTGTVINTGAGGAAGAQTVATEKIETGIILTVTPLVSSDGYILLDLQAKSSQADFTRLVDQIPTEISREANSHILVKDGQTVVLGGIYRDTMNEQQAGIPYLRSVPGLGWLFRNLSKTDRREDLLVFLTPRILTAPASGLPSASELWKHRNDIRG